MDLATAELKEQTAICSVSDQGKFVKLFFVNLRKAELLNSKVVDHQQARTSQYSARIIEEQKQMRKDAQLVESFAQTHVS